VDIIGTIAIGIIVTIARIGAITTGFAGGVTASTEMKNPLPETGRGFICIALEG
jgi:hypothetical protein